MMDKRRNIDPVSLGPLLRDAGNAVHKSLTLAMQEAQARVDGVEQEQAAHMAAQAESEAKLRQLQDTIKDMQKSLRSEARTVKSKEKEAANAKAASKKVEAEVTAAEASAATMKASTQAL